MPDDQTNHADAGKIVVVLKRGLQPTKTEGQSHLLQGFPKGIM